MNVWEIPKFESITQWAISSLAEAVINGLKKGTSSGETVYLAFPCHSVSENHQPWAERHAINSFIWLKMQLNNALKSCKK